MIADGLFTRFPKPDFALALHDSGTVPAGQIAWVEGYAYANVDSVDITLFGKGGHGAKSDSTVDPIVLAARTILALQTIISREKDPMEPGVITVGSIHAGTKHNIIPDEAKLQLTVHSYAPAWRRSCWRRWMCLRSPDGFPAYSARCVRIETKGLHRQDAKHAKKDIRLTISQFLVSWRLGGDLSL